MKRTLLLVLLVCLAVAVYGDEGAAVPDSAVTIPSTNDVIEMHVHVHQEKVEPVVPIDRGNEHAQATMMSGLTIAVAILGIVVALASVLLFVAGLLGITNYKQIQEFKTEMEEKVSDTEDCFEKYQSEYEGMIQRMSEEKGSLFKEVKRFQLKYKEKGLKIEDPNLTDTDKWNLQQYIRNTDTLSMFGQVFSFEDYEMRWKAYMLLELFECALEETDKGLLKGNRVDDWREMKARVQTQQNKLEDAEKTLETTEKDEEIPTHRLMLQAQIANLREEYGRALYLCDGLIERSTADAFVWYTKGVALAGLGKNVEALGSFDRTLEMRPNDEYALNSKGITLGKLGRLDEALKTFEQAINLQPEYAIAWYHKGLVLLRLDRIQDALAAFEEAIRLQPHHADAWLGKGAALSILGRKVEALSAYEESIRLHPNYVKAWFNKACVLALLERKPEMLTSLKRAIEQDSGSKEKARTDEDFKAYWDDPEFIALTKDDDAE